MNWQSGVKVSLWTIVALFCFSCTGTQAKNPVFKNTRWVCVQEHFVADAGTLTETYTLEFTSGKECLWKDSWILPAHPAMYMNRNGTVDTIPVSGSEKVSRATWRFSRNKLTLQFEDGSTKVFLYEDGRLSGPGPFDTQLVFELVKGAAD